MPTDVRGLARLISLVEDGGPGLRSALAQLRPAPSTRVIGLTGAPGVGKSTSTAALVTAYRELGLKVAVLAVDPSSPFSGGALLGDRVRMQAHAGDADVYIRSMATRGHLGGLSRATPQAVRVLSAAGFDVVLIETVGVGQAEVDIAALADTTVVLLAPGMGDSVQAAKAGILEVADVLVVNKADRDGASLTVRDLQAMLSYADRDPAGWTPPIIRTVALTGLGIDELVAAIEGHAQWAAASGVQEQRRLGRAAAEVRALVVERLMARVDGSSLPALAGVVAAGEMDAYAAADALTVELAD